MYRCVTAIVECPAIRAMGLFLRDSFAEVLTLFDQVAVNDGGVPGAVFVHCAAVTLMFLDELQSV
jgi:hypothetical protein